MVKNRKKVVVVGGGSFGTAIANIVADNDNDTWLWSRDKSVVAEIKRSHANSKYLSGFPLNSNLHATTSLEEAVQCADVIFVAIPSKAFAEVVRAMKPFLQTKCLLISCTKGIEENGFLLMSQVLVNETGSDNVGVLSGPNLAKELAARTLTGSVIASSSESVRTVVQEVLSCSYFRVYASTDIFGVELGGALKNIYAIATGMASALGMGENTKGMLITRSLAEISRFAAKMGANPLSFLGLAGVGDLFVTCTSSQSRNYQVGYAVGQGVSLNEAVESLGQTAEGVNTIRLVKNKADELGIYMPLVEGLFEILYHNKAVADVISRLMLSDQNSDVEFILPSTKSS